MILRCVMFNRKAYVFLMEMFKTKNLTSGSPLKLIFTFSIPILISNLFQQLYSMVDAIFIGNFIGTDALAGVTASSFLLFCVFGFVYGISTGCAIILARKFGAKSSAGMKLCIVNSIYILIIVGAILTILSVLSCSWMLKFLNSPPEIMPYAQTYTLISFASILPIMAYNMFSQLLRSIGDNKAALLFLVFSVILNIVLDYLFVAVFHFSVTGAAFATTISEMISAICCIIYLFKKYEFTRPSRKYLKLNRTFFFYQLKLGIPMAFECSVCGVGLLFLQQAINSMGPCFVAGFGIAMRIEDLIITTFLALAHSASVFVSQNFGAKKFIRIKKGASKALLIGLVFCAIFIIIFLALWDFFVQLFINNEQSTLEAISKIKLAAHRYMDITLLHYPALCCLIILRSVVQSLGKTFIPLCGSIIELLARAFGAFVLGFFFHYDGICYATILAWWLAFVPMMFSFVNNIKKLLKNSKSFENADPKVNIT